MSRTVVSGLPLPCQSWLHLILVRNISIKPISGTHQKSKLALMVLHAIVEKLTTWKAPLPLSQPHWPRKCPLLIVASRKVRPINALNNITPTVLPQVKNAKLFHPENNVSHTAELISPKASTSSVLVHATSVPVYATDTHSSPLTMGPQLHPPYGVPACTPVSTCPLHVPPAAHMYYPGPSPLSSHQSTTSSHVTQSTHQLPITVIHRIQDTEPKYPTPLSRSFPTNLIPNTPRRYWYPFFDTIGFYHSYNVPSLHPFFLILF